LALRGQRQEATLDSLNNVGDYGIGESRTASRIGVPRRDVGRNMSSRQSLDLRLRLLQPQSDVHLAVHRRSREMLSRRMSIAPAPIELAEAEVTVGDERVRAAGSASARASR
jgi:hypothetical protein